MESIVELLVRALRRPLDALFGSEQRIFLPFLATSAVMAAIVWAISVRPRGRASLLAYVFPRKVFLHRSSLLDAQIIVVRALLALVLVVPLFLSTIAVAVAVARTLRHSFGVTTSTWSGSAVAAAFTLAGFVADDLTRYLVHLAMHRIPALWELHKVHHSAEVLTPFTLQRVHPLEGFLMAIRSTVTLGVVTGVFIWCFPGKVRGYHVLGADAAGFVFAALGANLRHSHVWLSYGRALERVAISPAQHQIHHSVDEKHYDRNFGAALAIWDWMFGTLYVTRGYERLAFGLTEGDRNHGPSVVSAMIDPLIASLRALVPARLRDRSSGRPAASGALRGEPRTDDGQPDTPGPTGCAR